MIYPLLLIVFLFLVGYLVVLIYRSQSIQLRDLHEQEKAIKLQSKRFLIKHNIWADNMNEKLKEMGIDAKIKKVIIDEIE